MKLQNTFKETHFFSQITDFQINNCLSVVLTDIEIFVSSFSYTYNNILRPLIQIKNAESKIQTD